MPFSEPRYVKCPNGCEDGKIEREDPETGYSKWADCPLCEGSGKILDEQIQEEE
jgi:hypothetical protein